MLKTDSEFQACFLDAHTQELQTYVLKLLGPLLNTVELQKKDVGISSGA